MNRQQALQQMIQYRHIYDNQDVEGYWDNYCNAWEVIADLKILSVDEIPSVVASFSDKSSNPEFLHPLEDLILLAVKTEQDFDVFMDAVLQNREGIEEACIVLYSMLHYNKNCIQRFVQKMNVLKEENSIEFSWYFAKMKLFALTNRETFNEYLIPLEEEGMDVRQVVQDLYDYHKTYWRSFSYIMGDFKQDYPEEYAWYRNEIKLFAENRGDTHFLSLMAQLD